jgi:hypothetical protein
VTMGESGGSLASGPLPQNVDEQALEAGAVAEATLALAQLWSIASSVHEVGARLSFTLWSERGALTLTSYSAAGRPGPLGPALDDEALQEELAKILTRFAQRHTGAIELTLVRHQTRWTVTYSTSSQPRSPEAKTIPVRRAGLPAGLVEAVSLGVEQVLRAVEVPSGAEAQVEFECSMEEDRAGEWRLRLFNVTHAGPGGAHRSLSSSTRGEVKAVLLPFTQGLGERTVILRLKLLVPLGARQAHGWVEEARVERPPVPAELNAEFVAEYRAMHEGIQRRWREETRTGAEWVARRGAEELAVWYAGGIAIRGLGWLGARMAPTVLSALRRGGGAATGWLRTMLTRLAPEERLAFERLWAKVQLEGKSALSGTERQELRSLMTNLEELIHTPLDDLAKRKLRGRARDIYMAAHPRFEQILKARGQALPIHHQCPLEYAHLFPERDINAANNLVMLTREVHERINAIWVQFRRARPQATAKEVETVARTIEERFALWYHQPQPPAQLPYSVQEAEEIVLKQLRRLFPEL